MAQRLSDDQLTAKLEAQKAKARTRLDSAKRQQKIIDAQLRAVEQAAAQKRRLRWASIAEQVGLFQLDDTTLQEVLTVALALVNRHGGRMPRAIDDHGTGIAELHGVPLLVFERNGTDTQAAICHAGSVESEGLHASTFLLHKRCECGEGREER